MSLFADTGLGQAKKKSRIRRSELAFALLGLAAVLLLLYSAGSFQRVYVNSEEVVVDMVPETDAYGVTKKRNRTIFNLNEFYLSEPLKIDVSIEPEFLSSLNASVPKEKVCRKIRYKKVPLNSVNLDGDPVKGDNWMRYRGFCYPHWYGERKSVKLNLGKRYRGYKTLNANSVDTDPSLFDIWAGQLAALSGNLTSRIGFARLSINGKDQGIRFLSENLDKSLLKDQLTGKLFENGSIYREIASAFIGHGAVVKRGAYIPVRDVNHLKEVWKKNSSKSSSWSPFLTFNQAIYDGVVTGSDDWRKAINIDHYVNYLALHVITGTHHQNNHNIPVYLPDEGESTRLRRQGVVPIGYDYGAPFASAMNSKLRDQHVYVVSQNWPTSLIWSSPDLRKRGT